MKRTMCHQCGECWSVILGISIVAIAFTLGGCLIIPTDYYSAGVRHNIKSDAELELREGVTTKEEVIFTLGEPDYASEDGRQIGYAWRKVKALLIVISNSGGGTSEFEKSYLLRIGFDGSNRVSRVERLQKWGSQVPIEIPNKEERNG